MNYIYGSICILGKKLYDYLVSVPIIRYDKNENIVKRIDTILPWYTRYRYFFSESKEIIPNLFLGSSFNAFNKSELDKKNISVVLNITDEINNFYETENNITYYRFPIRDNNIDDISSILEESYNVIEHHLGMEDRILVHCYMGASRSASVVMNYIMKKYSVSYEQTLNLIKKERPIVNLTEKFHNILNSRVY
jgi:protein-tyrosine phosphatase